MAARAGEAFESAAVIAAAACPSVILVAAGAAFEPDLTMAARARAEEEFESAAVIAAARAGHSA